MKNNSRRVEQLKELATTSTIKSHRKKMEEIRKSGFAEIHKQHHSSLEKTSHEQSLLMEVCKIFMITSTTLWSWGKKEILKQLPSIGGRVYYTKNAILN